MNTKKTGSSSFIKRKNTCLLISFHFLFVFHLFSLFAYGNNTSCDFNHQYVSLYGQSNINGSPIFPGPAGHHHFNPLQESIVEQEDHVEVNLSLIDIYYPLIHHIHNIYILELDKSFSTLPSLFFQKEDHVSLFILFRSMKDSPDC